MEKIVFDNGFTVALSPMEGVRSAAVSFFIAAGNRFETEKLCGVSHFIEHMVFKGTKTRTTEMIAEQSDIMGGQLNAYTSKEYTCFYSRALTEHVGRTLHLISDMICNPLFKRSDIETEKGVILEEIGMYEDSPEELCADMLTALCYKGQPLGFNILGTRESVMNMTGRDLRGYMEKTYVPERMVVSVCGAYDRQEVLDILKYYFGGKHNTMYPISYDTVKCAGGFALCRKDVEQTQISVCYNGLPLSSPLKVPCSFFSTIVGGASSSRINRRIREELGLAYSVYSFSSSYLGTGMFGISGGLAHENQERFIKEALYILHTAADSITDSEIERTREQFKAGLVLSNESMSSVAASMGRQLLLEGKYTDLGGIISEIDAVTAESVKEAAALVTDRVTAAVSVVGERKGRGFLRFAFVNVQLPQQTQNRRSYAINFSLAVYKKQKANWYVVGLLPFRVRQHTRRTGKPKSTYIAV